MPLRHIQLAVVRQHALAQLTGQLPDQQLIRGQLELAPELCVGTLLCSGHGAGGGGLLLLPDALLAHFRERRGQRLQPL